MSQNRIRFMYVIASIATVFWSGCNKPAAKVVQQKTVQNTTESELDAVREGLKKLHPDYEHLRNVLNQFNGILSAEPQRRPAPLPAEDAAFLKDRLKLTDSQIAALNAPEFSLLDAHILDSAMLFRDVAKTLELNDAAPLVKARVALDWVTRHVRLEQRNGPPDPPDRVILRGRGTGLERIYVFVSLLQQLGIEAYCIGDETAASDPTRLWGVGVINGDEVALFDPRLGLSLPTTLSELQKDAKPLEGLIALGYDVTPDRLKVAKLFPGLPISDFAPRWKLVETLIPTGELQVAIDVNRLRSIAEKFPFSGWSPNTLGTPTRAFAEFHPTEEGGLDRAPLGPERRLARYQVDTIPWAALPREFAELQGPLGNQIRLAFVDVGWRDQQPGIAQIVKQQKQFAETRRQLELEIKAQELPPEQLLGDIARDLQKSRMAGDNQGPTLMEMLLRGQNSEAIEIMVALIDEATKYRNQSLSPDAVMEWLQKANSAFKELMVAQRNNDRAALEELKVRFNTIGREAGPAVELVRQRAAGAILARLNYLIALSKHDQAEVRSRQDPKTDWKTVVQIWANYLNNFPNADEAQQAKRLLAAALERAGQHEAAADAYRRAAGSAPLLFDRIACAWLAKNTASAK